jgi:hypothetical protein
MPGYSKHSTKSIGYFWEVRDVHRGRKEFKKRYQPRKDTVKYENVVLLADSHNIFNKWKLHINS